MKMKKHRQQNIVFHDATMIRLKRRIQKNLKKKKEQIIELDCKPGEPRPGDLIEDVIRDTGLPFRHDKLHFMGSWEWDYSDIEEKVWAKAQPVLKKRITSLYNRGLIRYGSWG